MALQHSFSLYSELFIINLLFMVYGLCFISLLPKKTISSVKSDTRPDFSVLPLATRTLNNAPHVVKAEISLFKTFPTLTGISSPEGSSQFQGLVSTEQAVFRGSRHVPPSQLPSVPSSSEGQNHKTLGRE